MGTVGFSIVSPGDVSLVLWTTTTNSWLDVIAPYGETTVGAYSSIDCRSVSKRWDANRNVAILDASKKVLTATSALTNEQKMIVELSDNKTTESRTLCTFREIRISYQYVGFRCRDCNLVREDSPERGAPL